MGDEKPSHFSGRGSLEVPCEAATATEPRKGPFDDPAPRQELEAFDPGRPFYNLDVPPPAMGKCVDELFPAIHPVGEDVLKLGKAVSQALQQGDSTVDILNVCGMNMDSQEETVGVGNDVSLTAIDALARVKAGWAAGLRR